MPSCVSLVFILLAVSCAETKTTQGGLAPDTTGVIRTEIPRHELSVDGHAAKVRLALTNAARKQGLSGIESLADDEGMLFVYREAWRPLYWMKDCEIALDIAFLADDGTILKIDTMQPPKPGTRDDDIDSSETPAPCRLVLELPAGFFARHGIQKGGRVVLPAAVRFEDAERRD